MASSVTASSTLPWVQHFTQLGKDYFTQVNATPLTNPDWVHINHDVETLIGLDRGTLQTDHYLDWLSGNGNLPRHPPIAMVYAGHQFGGYSAQLGDGRGLLLGQLELASGVVDLHLKGAGKTPYSRFGDGRAVLRSSIREYLAGEAMHALGISSSRALCVTVGDDVVKREKPEPAAMLTRVAKTHIRFGHFEYFHYQQQFEQVKRLADHVIQQFLPEVQQQSDRYSQLLHFVVKKTAMMIAQWQSVGFAHGVMNTDNMSIIGETLDYGPYGFMDDYEPGLICNHSDYQGRYAFDQQPDIGLWNLHALAHSLSSLIDDQDIQAVLATYEPVILTHYTERMRAKFGWYLAHETDASLCADILQLMSEDHVDYTQFFRQLCDVSIDGHHPVLETLFRQQERFRRWQQRYCERLQIEPMEHEQRQQRMKAVNPKYILRNYLLQTAIDQAQQHKNYTEIDQLMKLIKAPCDEHKGFEHYASPPPAWGKHMTISCSS